LQLRLGRFARRPDVSVPFELSGNGQALQDCKTEFLESALQTYGLLLDCALIRSWFAAPIQFNLSSFRRRAVSRPQLS